MLKDKESFSIIICEDETEEEKIRDTVQKISLRKQIKYNRIKLKELKDIRGISQRQISRITMVNRELIRRIFRKK